MCRTNTSNAQEEEVLAFEVKKYPCQRIYLGNVLYALCFFLSKNNFLTQKLRFFLAERFDRLFSNKNIAITSSSLSKACAIFDIVNKYSHKNNSHWVVILTGGNQA